MRRWIFSTEIALWIAALLFGGALVTYRVRAAAAQKTADTIVPGITADETSGPVPTDGILGRVEIPALHLSTPLVEDTDPRALRLGAGHIPGTAMPGGLGNFGIAAHRDTFFRALSGIKRGMAIRVVTTDGTYTYVVDATTIVLPENVDVLDTGDVPQMTLVTCYPFHYIGAAPKRFVVTAHLTSF